MALIDEEINFTTSEWKAIESIIQILKPIGTIVLQFCSRNINLMETDVTTAGLFDKGIHRDLLGMNLMFLFQAIYI